MWASQVSHPKIYLYMYVQVCVCVSWAFADKASMFTSVEISWEDVMLCVCLIMEPVNSMVWWDHVTKDFIELRHKTLYNSEYCARTAFYYIASSDWIWSVNFTFFIPLALASKRDIAIVNSCVYCMYKNEYIVYMCSIQVRFSVIQVSFEKLKFSCNQIWVEDTGVTLYLYVSEFKGCTLRSKAICDQVRQKMWNWYSYSPIAFNERVTFWLQRVQSLPCACAYVALFAHEARV